MKSQIRQHGRDYNEKLREFRNNVSLAGYYVSWYWLVEYKEQYAKKINIHIKKLSNLGYNNIKHSPSEKTILNFSSTILIQDEKYVCSLGANFA